MPCGEPGGGATLPAGYADMIRAVHDAACRRDHDGLVPFMTDPFDAAGRSPAEVVAAWREAYPDGTDLAVLAATLETLPRSDQGGVVFCQPSGAIVAFARGTHDRPGGLSEFSITRYLSSTAC
ncbi:hypothetical protein CKY47_17815 [Saccharothrix yanglingensis]|uniref:SnoaL-like domain-containing protein n=1 Tax=Saccharothrix yanglingensis TaxID=659496 RepID=A0ABU0X102_9PSEU|nr:hypothetical protein [Saccharothrix yanglingensis]